jgi:hypothetical protein
VVDVLVDAGHRGEDMPDGALPVDHVGHPAGQDAEGTVHAVALPDRAAVVAEQQERQPVAAGERLV